MDRREEERLTNAMVKWIHQRADYFGGICRTIDGQSLDWGQAICYAYYGPEWNNEDMSIIPIDVLDCICDWDDKNPPEWVDREYYPEALFIL